MKVKIEQENVFKSAGMSLGRFGLMVSGIGFAVSLTAAAGSIAFPPLLPIAAMIGGASLGCMLLTALPAGVMYGVGAAYDGIKNKVSDNKVEPLNVAITTDNSASKDIELKNIPKQTNTSQLTQKKDQKPVEKGAWMTEFDGKEWTRKQALDL